MLSPIVTVVQKEGIITKKKLLIKIKSLIKKQNVKNSIPIFKAISLISPGGLGVSKKYDVNKMPKTKLYKAMEFSKKIAKISLQTGAISGSGTKEDPWITPVPVKQ